MLWRRWGGTAPRCPPWRPGGRIAGWSGCCWERLCCSAGRCACTGSTRSACGSTVPGLPTRDLSPQHAQAWANMVQSVNDYANNRVMIMPIKVWAAVDFEPDWSTYGIAYTWIQAYSHTGASDYLNFGSTDGYPAPAPGDPAPVVPPSWG